MRHLVRTCVVCLPQHTSLLHRDVTILFDLWLLSSTIDAPVLRCPMIETEFGKEFA